MTADELPAPGGVQSGHGDRRHPFGHRVPARPRSRRRAHAVLGGGLPVAANCKGTSTPVVVYCGHGPRAWIARALFRWRGIHNRVPARRTHGWMATREASRATRTLSDMARQPAPTSPPIVSGAAGGTRGHRLGRADLPRSQQDVCDLRERVEPSRRRTARSVDRRRCRSTRTYSSDRRPSASSCRPMSGRAAGLG